ncbi:MAG: 2-hydroxyacid dehydrogenase [Casimicrobiaceae bacterium]
MPNADILITAVLPPLLSVPLARDYRCIDYVKSADKSALLAAEGANIRGLVQGGGTVQSTELLDALPKLEIISVFGVGYDGVPIDYCRKRGIQVTNTPDVLTEDVADTAVALLLMCARGFLTANRLLLKGDWSSGSGTLTTKVAGKRAGILGLGRIGKAIASRLTALQMRIAYSGRNKQDVAYEFVPDLAALAARSDFLIIAAPGGPATRNLVDADVLKALGSNGTLINIARGTLVDEVALVAALKAGTIRTAGLDVFANEPNVPAELLAMDNVVLLPHVASATSETRQAMGDLCRANLDSWFAGEGVKTLVPELR